MLSPCRALLASSLLLSLAAAATPPPDPVAQKAQEYAQAAMQRIADPRATASLVRMHALREDLDDLAPLAQTYEAISNRRRAHPLVRATARMLLLDVERSRGHLERASGLLAQLGFVQDFWVLGGFENEGKSACDADAGPEAKLDLTATYPVRGGEVHWQRLPVKSGTGFVDLASAVRPNNGVVAYAATVLDAPQEERVTFGIGTAGAFRLWVNGQLAAKSDAYNRARPDQARVSVRLAKGPNRVLLKVCEDSEGLGFYLRAEPERGRLAASAPDALPPAPRLPIQPQVQPTVAALLAEQVKKRPDDARLRGDFAAVLDAFSAYDARSHTATAEAERAAAAAPQDADLQLLAADLHKEDHNLRRARVEAAFKAAPGSPLATLALAELELDRQHPERALALLEPLVKQQPQLAAARVRLARAHTALGEITAAIDLVDQAMKELSHSPQVIREGARMSRRLERPQEALARLRVAVALRFDDAPSRSAMANILADLGKVDEAARERQALVALDPFDNSERLRAAELLAANGRLEPALRLFAEAKQLSPSDPDVHEREGRALLQAGRKEEAVTAFERSLQLRPQNPALKEVVRALEGETAAYGAQYLVDVKPLVPEADSFAGEDAIYVVDTTYVRVQPTGLSSRLQQLAVKVYSQRGVDAFRRFPITYSPDRQEVRVMRARITKPDGSLVESYGDSDRNINEPWSGMYYDARAKVLSFPALAPGDLLEIQYRLEDTAQENLLSDYWGDVDYVQSSAPKVKYQYLVDMPAGRPLYWNKGRLGAGVKAEVEPLADGRQLYRFSAARVSKVLPEPMMPGWAEVATTLHVSTYQTWEQVGRYYWGLVRDQLTPDDELRKTVDQALSSVDRKDKMAVVRAVYDWVVTNTRYVALEFGIHGYKPYRVDRVLARRFGDCKDKASLIHAMLGLAGVDSRLVLLRMRHLGDIGEEPASLAAFNHAIVYVPELKLFLDGTAEFHGASELPSSDRNAGVLVIEPSDKSPFLVTPDARAEDNVVSREVEVKLRTDGGAELSGHSDVVGQSAPQYRRAFQSPNTRKALFEQQWAQSFPGLTVHDVALSDLAKLEQAVQMTFSMAVPRYAEASPNALRFYTFGTGRTFTQSLAALTERRYDLVMEDPWTERLRFAYLLPDGFAPQDLPSAVHEKTPFGHLDLECKLDQGRLACDAELAIAVSRVKAEDYPAFRAFIGRVDQAFSRKILIVKTQTAER